MIASGYLPLSIIRGIEFPGFILQCRDDKVVVTGTLSPDATGTYVPSGDFSGYPLFILDGATSYFIYFNVAAASYVIAAVLTTGALTDFWLPSSPLTEPTGAFQPQGANTGVATGTDNPVDLTGYTPEAQVRRTSKSDVLLDLNPFLSDAVNGEITYPGMSTSDTRDIQFAGTFQWDFVLRDGAGERIGPFVQGPFAISDNITH